MARRLPVSSRPRQPDRGRRLGAGTPSSRPAPTDVTVDLAPPTPAATTAWVDELGPTSGRRRSGRCRRRSSLQATRRCDVVGARLAVGVPVESSQADSSARISHALRRTRMPHRCTRLVLLTSRTAQATPGVRRAGSRRMLTDASAQRGLPLEVRRRRSRRGSRRPCADDQRVEGGPVSRRGLDSSTNVRQLVGCGLDQLDRRARTSIAVSTLGLRARAARPPSPGASVRCRGRSRCWRRGG